MGIGLQARRDLIGSSAKDRIVEELGAAEVAVELVDVSERKRRAVQPSGGRLEELGGESNN